MQNATLVPNMDRYTVNNFISNGRFLLILKNIHFKLMQCLREMRTATRLLSQITVTSPCWVARTNFTLYFFYIKKKRIWILRNRITLSNLYRFISCTIFNSMIFLSDLSERFPTILKLSYLFQVFQTERYTPRKSNF